MSPRAETAVRKILTAGALPIDARRRSRHPDSGAARASRAAARSRSCRSTHHLDWRDDFNGVRDGLVEPDPPRLGNGITSRIFQIGIRAQGSARTEEVEAAQAYGRTHHRLRVHDVGMDAVLARIPDGGDDYLTIDADGMDPAAMPAVAGPGAGRRHLPSGAKLIHGLVKKGRVVGMDIVEITPRLDVNRITCITAGRLIVNLIGATIAAAIQGLSAWTSQDDTEESP